LALISELSFYSSKQKDKIDYFKSNLNSNGDGDKKTITSELKIKTTAFNFPLMVQYSIEENKDIRFATGLEFLFVSKPSLESYETKTKDTYVNNALTKTQIDIAQFNAKADVFSTVHTGLIFSLGKTFNISDKNFYIDLRYHLPITKSMMYTTNINYDNVVMKNNDVFDVWGKTDAEIDAPSFPINDFKLCIIEIYFFKGEGAGPAVTSPFILKLAPWQGHINKLLLLL